MFIVEKSPWAAKKQVFNLLFLYPFLIMVLV